MVLRLRSKTVNNSTFQVLPLVAVGPLFNRKRLAWPMILKAT
jgi:hypothetical protein